MLAGSWQLECAGTHGAPMISSALAEARHHRDFVLRNLTTSGARWVLAEGYITIWKRLHRAEEALIDAEPRTDVVADALYDEWRLQGSTVEHGDVLMNQLRLARQYLQSLSMPQARPAGAPPVEAAPEAPAVLGHPVASESDARAVVRSVRRTLNEFRDERWNGIVRARNLLMGTMLLTQLFAFALLALAVLQRAPGSAVGAAIVFFLVGAVVGLFNRLSRQATTETTVDDYSLTGVRVLVTPVFSGLAAIGGVVLTGTLTMSGLTGLVQPAGPPHPR